MGRECDRKQAAASRPLENGMTLLHSCLCRCGPPGESIDAAYDTHENVEAHMYLHGMVWSLPVCSPAWWGTFL